MAKLLAALVTFALLVGSAEASLLRVELTRANQATSPVTFVVRITKVSGLVAVALELPQAQAPLAHLWRIDLVLRRGKQTVAIAPLETKLDGDTLRTELLLDPGALKGAEIWIRTGEHAPLAETVYAIVVATFR